jgi:pyruvate,water dikinase
MGGRVETIAWFDRHDPANEPVLGGKNTSLGILTTAGLPVPLGFAVTAGAYRLAFQQTGIDVELDGLMAGLDPRDPVKLSTAGTTARDLVIHAGLPAWLVDEIHSAYATLSERCDSVDLPVAVRSSATCEDQPDASFAGEHDTYLWIRSADQVTDHLLRCWASLYTDRAIAYRRQMSYPDAGAAMSVGIQQMVLPRAAGVAFTLNPLDGDRSQVAIDASWGLGEAVVSGSVTPDNFLVDKVLGEITKRTISAKTVEHTLDGNDHVVEVEVDEARRCVACVTDDEIRAVAQLARRAEKHYGRPQDVEWAIDPRLAEGENIVLLQSRPETVWSRRPREHVDHNDMFRSMVGVLLDPNHGRVATTG